MNLINNKRAGTDTMTRCNYCDNILSLGVNKSSYDEILFTSTDYVVTPTLGAFIKGWTLIISKRHIPSMSQLFPSEIQELKKVIAAVRRYVEQIYDTTVVFEHGSLELGSDFGCGVDHAHIHVVPFKNQLLPLINEELNGIKWRRVERLEQITKERKSYVFVIDRDTSDGVISNPKSIPSQFIRRILAKNMGMMDYFDYHKHSFEENASLTFHSLHSVLNLDSV